MRTLSQLMIQPSGRSARARHTASLSIANSPYPVRLLVAIVVPIATAMIANQLLTWLPVLLGK